MEIANQQSSKSPTKQQDQSSMISYCSTTTRTCGADFSAKVPGLWKWSEVADIAPMRQAKKSKQQRHNLEKQRTEKVLRNIFGKMQVDSASVHKH